MKIFSLSLLVAVASCGGSKPAGPVSGQADSTSIAPLDTVLAQLESMRTFIVIKDGNLDCAAYTPAATELVGKIAASTPDANTARTSGTRDAVAEWQRVHAPALEKLLVEVATPTRNVTTCEAMSKDETWSKVSFALVAIAQPAQPPAAILARGALLDEMLARSASVKSREDCKKLGQELIAKHPTLEQELKALSPIEQFIDDKVWDEDEEKRMKADPRFENFANNCI